MHETKEEKGESTYLLDEEKKLLDRSVERREIMLDSLFKDGKAPEDKQLRIANEILGAHDASILTRIGLRQKDKHHEDEQATTAAMLESQNNIIHKRILKYKKTKEDEEIILGDVYVPTDIVPGEDAVKPRTIDVDKFFKG